MEQVLNIADVVKQHSQGQQFPVHAFGTGIRAEQGEDVMRDIEMRATVLGPVLEGMFRDHWEHWGLNE